jgi:flagellar hook-associated protein 1 FlgK
MSIAGLSSALSSLSVIQKQLGLASANIANADVDGYTTKTVKLSTVVSGGTGSGVSSSVATSSVDKFLLQDIAAAKSAAGKADTLSDFYASLQQLFGDISSSDATGSDLSSALSDLTDAVDNLSGTPDSDAYKQEVVTALDDVADQLRSTSSGVQDLRTQADQQISDTVDTVNGALDEIASLNAQIRSAKAAGQSTADLEDQRTTALQTVASAIDVSYYTDQYGNLQIYTAGNQILVDSSAAYHLSHTAASLSDGVTYAGGGIDGITVNGVDITSKIKTGSIAALVEMRDTALPNVQSELDNLASSLGETVNGIFNGGTASPPASTLTGTADVAAADAVTVASGTTIRVTVTDQSGTVTGTSDIDISGATTVADIASALSSVSGVTAAVVDGHLQVSVADDSGIAVATLSGTVNGTDLSSAFGLNDVLTDTDSAATIAIRGDLLDSPALLATGTLSTESGLAVGDTAVTSGDGTIAEALSDALTGKTSFTAAGWLGSSKQTLAGYAASIVGSVATRVDAATDNATSADSTLSTLQSSFADQSGVNTDTETARISELQNAYAASAQVLSAIDDMFQSLLNAVGG